MLPECGFVVERSSILGGVKRMVKVCSSVGGRIFRIEHAPIYPLLRLRVIGVNRGSDSFWGARRSATDCICRSSRAEHLPASHRGQIIGAARAREFTASPAERRVFPPPAQALWVTPRVGENVGRFIGALSAGCNHLPKFLEAAK